MAVRAIACGSWMLKRGSLDLLRLVRVAAHAQLFDLSLNQNNLPALRRGVTRVALLLGEGIVRELLQQLRAIGLMWIVAFKTIGFAEGLAAMRIDEPRQDLSQRIVRAIGKVARDTGQIENGYRLLANTGLNSGQEVPHLHVHIFAGRPLGPMLARA